MRRRSNISAAILAAALLFCLASGIISCGRRGESGGGASSEIRHFPEVAVPAVYSNLSERLDYILSHFWDQFFSGSGLTDSTHLLGVEKGELETSLANFIAALDEVPLEKAEKYIGNLFNGIVKAQQADTSSKVYILMTQTVAHYLYDPNSPQRNEDYYLPFVKAMASCPLTPEEMRPAYAFEAQSCSICRGGTVAPDFRIRRIDGSTFRLHSVKAEYTMLFFSNPGCQACKGIVEEVQSTPLMLDLIDTGRLAVVNVYIDQDIKAWKEYEPFYPRSWKTGYDPDYVIRGERLYDVRAIPSLYLLDAEKRIIYKDAPTGKVIKYLTTKTDN